MLLQCLGKLDEIGQQMELQMTLYMKPLNRAFIPRTPTVTGVDIFLVQYIYMIKLSQSMLSPQILQLC